MISNVLHFTYAALSWPVTSVTVGSQPSCLSSLPSHHFISSVIQTPLFLCPPLLPLDSFSSDVWLKDSSWPPLIYRPCSHFLPHLLLLFIHIHTNRHVLLLLAPSPLWRVTTIETGEPKWQQPPACQPALVWLVPRGSRHVSLQPILMHVFRDKLASLLKSLLWPMNIWCGQGCGVDGYNDKVLSYLARQTGSDPEHSTVLPRSGILEKEMLQKQYLCICLHLWREKTPGPISAVGWKPNWEQNASHFLMIDICEIIMGV